MRARASPIKYSNHRSHLFVPKTKFKQNVSLLIIVITNHYVLLRFNICFTEWCVRAHLRCVSLFNHHIHVYLLVFLFSMAIFPCTISASKYWLAAVKSVGKEKQTHTQTHPLETTSKTDRLNQTHSIFNEFFPIEWARIVLCGVAFALRVPFCEPFV